MKRSILLSMVLCMLINPYLSKADDASNKLQFGFIENKGQVLDQDNKPNAAVQYLLNTKGLNVQLRKDGFSYDAFVIEDNNAAQRLQAMNSANPDEVSVTYKFHRVDITLEGADKNCKIITGEANADYINYYTGGIEALNVHHYNTVTYKNIYPGIDLEFTTQAANTVEYNFIVHPGADPSQIKLRYEGMNNISLSNNRINISVAHGNIQEKIPESYIAATHKAVRVNYNLTNKNTFGFDVAAYDRTQTLIIDPKPDIAWATYYGGSGLDVANSVATHSSPSVLMTGSTLSSTGIATTGAHQVSISSLSDVFIASFSPGGTRQWATYYGGTGEDIGYGIAGMGTLTGNIHIAVTGKTTSGTGFASTGAHQTTLSGTNGDAFLATFNIGGQLQWCTYYGEVDADAGYSVASAGTDIFMCGTTASPMLITSSTGQANFNGMSDAFLVKFNGSGAFQWATYAGEMMRDEGYGVATDASGNVFLSGVVFNGMGGDLVTSGAHQTTYGGDTTDYFLQKYLGSNGTLQWGTYYGGSGGEYAERGNKLATNGAGHVYMAGATYSTNDIATTGSFQDALNTSSKDGFIVKFNGNGLRLWGTYYGSSSDETLIALTANGVGDVYAIGNTNSLGGLATTDAVQTSAGGGTDVFVAAFDNTGSRLWASYFGGNLDEYGNGIAVDLDGHVFIGGNTASMNGLATTGAHQSSHGGGTTDAFLARLNACKVNNLAYISSKIGAGCFGQANGAITISNVTGGIAPYQYKLSPNPFQSSGTFNNLAAGVYQVTVKDGNSCESTTSDTVTSYPQILTPITIIGATSAQAFYTQSYHLDNPHPQTDIEYRWYVVTGNGTFPYTNEGDTTTVLWGHVGSGTLKVVASSGPGCADSVNYIVNITPSSVKDITADAIGIYPNPATDQLNVQLKFNPEKGEQLRLYDNFGRLVLSQELKQEQIVDLSNLASGVYNLNIGQWNTKVSKL